MTDVVVVGGGLAGLAAARDLMLGGADVVCLEARERPGGRVFSAPLEDGREAQMGGELIGEFHIAYLGLARELGLATRPSYVAEPGRMTWDLAEGVQVGDEPPWFDAADVADQARVQELLGALARTVDPDDPWRHPDAERLDRLSVADWLRDIGARPAVMRAVELAHLGVAGGSSERVALLSALRMDAVAGGMGGYDLETWEGLTLADGSAALPRALAAELGERLRLGAPVRAITIGPRVTVELRDGETLRAEAVVCAVPAGPLRDLRIEGLSPQRLRSLRRMRHSLAAKVVAGYGSPFWREQGQNGLAESEGVLGSTWPQSEGVLSILVPPERLAHHLAAPADARREQLVAALVRLYGTRAAEPTGFATIEWGAEPFTQGYVTQWAPGDLTAVGPLHGTHEPPFYVAGSDHWGAGYMEGAVRTGRGAAAAAVGRAVDLAAPRV